MSTNVFAFIDGFNLYHSMSSYPKVYQWCNIRCLLEQFLTAEEILNEVYFFTAYPSWNKEKEQRHKKYISVLKEISRVTTILGKFQIVNKEYNQGQTEIISTKPEKLKEELLNFKYQTYEEKQTDVNIAIKIFEQAMIKKQGKFFILSDDSDFIPAIKMVKKYFKEIQFINLSLSKKKGKAIKRECHKHLILTKENFKDSMLPNEIMLKSGERFCSPYL